jgi:hypothetical protein
MALTTTLVAHKYSTPPLVNRAQGTISGTYTAATVTSATTPATTAAATGGIADSDAVSNMTITGGVMTINLGFAPKKFTAINCTDRVRQEWFAGMAAANFLETAANGTVTLETDGTANINPSASSNTVVVTFSGGIATDNDTMVWEAIG